jgi:hypothetical protein
MFIPFYFLNAHDNNKDQFNLCEIHLLQVNFFCILYVVFRAPFCIYIKGVK